MKNIFKYILLACAVCVQAGCARSVSEGANEANKRYFDAWLKVNNISGSQKIGRGVYVVDYEKKEVGQEVKADGYALVNYKTTDLEGDISVYTYEEVAKQLGAYDPTVYYGELVWTTTPETIRAGILDGITGMKVGEKKTFIVPSWLMSYENFETEEEYLAQTTDAETSVFEVEIVDFTFDINQWQFVQMARTMNNGIQPGTSVNDTTAYGFFYVDLVPPVVAEEPFPEDTTIYINYVGKLLNGLVFDTNIERVAKDNNLYVSGKTYGPTAVQWAAKAESLTLDDSEVISGFSKTLWQMGNYRKGTKGLGMFYSELGYGYSGSGNSIPGYAPLIFEIEFVDAPED